MEFLILGPLEVRDGESRVTLGGARQRAVLTLLLTRANEVVSKDRLIDEIWGEEPPESAANSLQVQIDYVAPEQIEGQETGKEADVYSLGCVLFECLTGKVPYRRESRMGVLWAHPQSPPPKASEHNPELPVGIDSVIARGMAKAPDVRYASCRALVEEAGRGLAISEITEAPPVPAPRSRRRLALALPILLAVLVAAAVLGALLLTGSDGGSEATVPPVIEKNSVARIGPGHQRGRGLGEGGTGAFRCRPERRSRLGRQPRRSDGLPHRPRDERAHANGECRPSTVGSRRR